VQRPPKAGRTGAVDTLVNHDPGPEYHPVRVVNCGKPPPGRQGIGRPTRSSDLAWRHRARDGPGQCSTSSAGRVDALDNATMSSGHGGHRQHPPRTRSRRLPSQARDRASPSRSHSAAISRCQPSGRPAPVPAEPVLHDPRPGGPPVVVPAQPRQRHPQGPPGGEHPAPGAAARRPADRPATVTTAVTLHVTRRRATATRPSPCPPPAPLPRPWFTADVPASSGTSLTPEVPVRYRTPPPGCAPPAARPSRRCRACRRCMRPPASRTACPRARTRPATPPGPSSTRRGTPGRPAGPARTPTGASCPVSGRSSGTQCGFGRNRQSATRSAFDRQPRTCSRRT